MLDQLPLEILVLITNYLLSPEHLTLFWTSSYFRIYLPNLVREIVFTRQKDIHFLYPRYLHLTGIELRDCLPPHYTRYHLRSLTLNYTALYRRKYSHSINFERLFHWITKLDLQSFSSNIEITPFHLPLILNKPHLRYLHLEYFIPQNLHLLNPEIEAISILLLRTVKITNLSAFKSLHSISIMGNLTPLVIKSLESLPRFTEDLQIKMTLLLTEKVKKKDLAHLPITSLNLSGFMGDLEIFSQIKSLRRIVFPSSTKKETIQAFKEIPSLQYRIAEISSLDLFDTGKGPYLTLSY